MTYNVFGETLNLAQSIIFFHCIALYFISCLVLCCALLYSAALFV